MKRPHFALPEIYDDSLSYYDVLRKLIKSMHVIVDNLNKIPEQIANEAKARLLGDQNLQQNINTEVSAREQGDTSLQNAINTEKSAREQADGTLQTNIDNEALARKQADQEIREGVSNKISELKGDLSAEQATREQADTSLQQEISGKLPKSPSNWEPWTVEEQGVARERMGLPGNFELVADIELTQETALVSINFEKYLRELYVVFSGTATSIGNAGITVNFDDGTKRQYAPTCQGWMNTSKRYAIAHILLSQGIIYSEASSGTTNNEWTPANLSTNLNGFMFLTETQKSIKRIDMHSLNNYSWSAGCKFTVYGVRA